MFVRLPAAEGRHRGEARVVLEPFLMAKKQITRAEWWRGVTTERPGIGEEEFEYPEYMAGTFSEDGPTLSQAQTGPEVVGPDARRFCEMTGLSLPTRVQWQYAYNRYVDGSVVSGRRHPNVFGLDVGVAFLGDDEQGQPVYRRGKSVGEWLQDGFVHDVDVIIGVMEPLQVCLRPVYYPVS